MDEEEATCGICGKSLVGEPYQDYDDNGDELGYDAHVRCLKERDIIS